MGKSKNNKGFTLAELIIAVAVLGIVISPLIANFIQSARINKKAKISLNATNMAQDVMEGASAYSAEDFVKMFESEEALTGKILPASDCDYGTHGDMKADGTISYVATNGAFKTDDGEIGDRQYTDTVVAGIATKVKKYADAKFFINDVQIKDKDGNLLPNRYNYRFSISANKTKYAMNDKYVANIAMINTTYDATYTIPASETQTAAAAFLLKSSGAGSLSEDNFIGKMSRDTTINIEDTDGTGTKYKIEVIRDYKVVTDAVKLGIKDEDNKYEESASKISSLKESQLPRSVYLYYTGIEGTTQSNVLDNFKVVNNTGKPITVYIIRTQAAEEVAANTDYNMNYGAKVDIISESFDHTPNTLTDIVSNLRYNLSEDPEKNYRVLQEGSNTALVEGRGYKEDDKLNTKYKADRCKYTYNGGAVDEALYLTNFSDGYQEEKKDFTYDLTLEVLDAATNDKIATFTGALSD